MSTGPRADPRRVVYVPGRDAYDVPVDDGVRTTVLRVTRDEATAACRLWGDVKEGATLHALDRYVREGLGA